MLPWGRFSFFSFFSLRRCRSSSGGSAGGLRLLRLRPVRGTSSWGEALGAWLCVVVLKRLFSASDETADEASRARRVGRWLA